MPRPKRLAGAFAAATLLAAGAASAHARLVASDPAAGAAVAPPRAVSLTFNERLTPAFSAFDLSSGDGRRAAAKVVLARDGRTLIGTPQRPLAAGAYTVDWRAVSSDDGHRTEGRLRFTVR
ncbi:MAG: copper homeostasis periplasmic binding protein CopC [Caulobacteraceae bacterium]|nr:copper homeostasis periplasmic binding protein CopC [Caulobacter sp.]